MNLFVKQTSFNQEIANLLKCGICWDYYNLPTVLPCGHTFCLKCIQEIGKHKENNVKTTKSGVDLSIDCPNCRQKVPVSDIQRMTNGVHVNYVLSSIVETVLQLESVHKVDASTNTDPDAYFDNKIGDIQKNIDDIFKVVNKRKSVVNDARKQIDELRLNTLKRTLTTAYTNKSNAPTQADSMQIQNTTMNNSSGEQTTWNWRLFHPEPLPPLNQDARNMPNQVTDLTDVDPAIVSVRTTRTNSLMNGSCWTMSML